MAGKSYIKIGSTNWDRIKKMYVKTGGQTWTAIRKAYVKTSSGWQKVFDTASNRPFIRNNDIPKIRLNTFRTDSSYNPTGTIDDPVNPVVEAPPVQQMGPSWTSPTYGWPYESLGRHLWGYDGDWVSGNGSAMTFVYTWLYNLSGNRNDNTEELGVTSTTGRTDMLTNLSSHLGQSDGDYFDRNFLTFRVTATNSAGSASFESAQVYIVRERPSGTATMIDADNASINSTMSATFTYSNNWYNKTDLAESYVEWFAVDNLTDTLTTSNRVQIEYLNTFSTTGTTTKSATTFHTPTISNKFYIVRTTLNNSNTLPAKYAGSVINIVGFTPNSAFTSQANKTAKTATANGPFNLTNGTKTGRYYDAASSTWRRYVSVDIGQSTSADRYEVQIEGQYEGSSGSYSLSSASWVVLQTLSVAPYVLESSRIGGTLTMPSVSALNYLNYRFTARSRNGTSLNGAAYSNNGTSTSFQYVSAASVAPSAPSISNIATSTDFQGSFVTFTNYMASTGSNEISYYTYSVDNGSNFQQPTSGFINATEGKVYVTAGSTVNLRIRATNLDGETSASSNLLSITAAVVPAAPTSVVVKSFSSLQGTIFLTAGANTQSVQGYLEYDSFSATDYLDGYVNVSAGNAGKIQLSGANSATRGYTAGVRPFSGQNLSGGSGAISTITTKVLNGSDNMQVSLGTITRPSDRTISLSWTATAGAPSHYVCRLYNYTSGSLISTKTILASSTSISFNSSDGVQYSTIYYIAVQPQYQYTSSVTYEDNNYTSGNINSGANLTAPTSTSIVSMSRLDNSTVRAYIGSSGGSGPYYQLYWISGSTAPSTTNYDAASTTSTVMEDFSFANGITYYFYIRSSNENLGNTITGGTATSGTYSDYGPTTGAASYTFASPTGGTASISGSTSTGSTLTLSLVTPSASPAADGLTITWRRADGGAGGNSFTGGTILQNGGTTYVITSGSVGYAIRAEVTWNNGVGSQSTNSNSVVATAASYTVTWNANGGSVSPSSASFTSGGFVTAPTPTRSGFSFNGWYDTVINDWNYFVSAGNQFYPPSRDITMYARWTAVPVNLTPPSIYYVAAGNAGGPVTAYFSGGSGPYYQIWWSSGGAGSSYDEYGAGNSITDNTGPGSAGTWYMYVRSVSSLTNVGTGPSATISDWSSAYAFTVTSSTPATAPGTPGTPTNGWTGGLSYPFSWTAPTAGTVSGGGAATITSYSIRIYRASSSAGTGSTLYNTYSSTSASYTFAAPDTQYYAAAVAATNSAGLTGNYSGISQYK